MSKTCVRWVALAPILAVSALLVYLAYSDYLTAVELSRGIQGVQDLAQLVSSCVLMLWFTVLSLLSAVYVYIGVYVWWRTRP